MTQKYGMGYSKTFIDVLKKRCIKTHAQFLIPYLKPGMKILDCGSGPGSMTIDFARYLQRGEVIGVDIEESQIAIATADAKRENVTNVTFQTADVFDLPFADDTFDLVFSQGLLVHLPDPIQALQEQRRVTKKGGIVTARSGYARGAIFHPENALLKEAWLFHNQPLLDQCVGIKLEELFSLAGLKDIKHSLLCDISRDQELANFFADEVINRDYSQKLLAQGKITLEKLQAYRDAWLNHAKTPHALFSQVIGEAIGVKV